LVVSVDDCLPLILACCWLYSSDEQDTGWSLDTVTAFCLGLIDEKDVWMLIVISLVDLR